MKVYKAQAVGDQIVPDLLIEATEPIPADGLGWAEHVAQAVALAKALQASLPGDTIDRLTAELLIAAVSRSRVRHDH